MPIEFGFNNKLWQRQNWLISSEGNRSILEQETLDFGLDQKELLATMKCLEAGVQDFSLGAAVYFLSQYLWVIDSSVFAFYTTTLFSSRFPLFFCEILKFSEY